MGLLIALALLGCMAATVSYFTNRNKNRILGKAPLKKIGEAGGLCTVTGKIAPDKELIAPYSQTTCVYFDFEIEYWYTSPKRNEWLRLIYVKDYAPFRLEDGSGIMYVDVAQADIDLYDNVNFESSDFRSDAQLMNKLLFLQRQYGFELPEKHKIRIIERVLKKGDEITIVSEAGTITNGQRCPLAPSGRDKYYLSDDNPEVIKKRTAKKQRLFLVLSILTGIASMALIAYKIVS